MKLKFLTIDILSEGPFMLDRVHKIRTIGPSLKVRALTRINSTKGATWPCSTLTCMT